MLFKNIEDKSKQFLALACILYFYQLLLDMVHTRGKSPQKGLRDVQTCEMTLASAYVLYYLPTV